MPITDVDLDTMLDKSGAAARLHMSTRTLDRLMSDREIEYIKIRQKVWFTNRAILDYLNRGKVSVEAPRRERKSRERAAAPEAPQLSATG